MKLPKVKNWKTTFFGFSAVISGAALIIKGDILGGITAIATGLGLTAAKDFDKTGL
jgi:hypothetical protein